jgi:hypothetical protein
MPGGGGAVMGWPAVFSEPIAFAFRSDLSGDDRVKAALAAQLAAWGCCAIANPPANFGEVMVKLGTISGAFTPDQCMAKADVLLGKSEVRS